MSWFMDVSLARRLERAEGSVGASFTAVRRELAPGSGATWRELAGAYAIFDTIDSPLTQTFGLGVFEPATPAVLSEIEAFFAHRGVDTMHEVSSLAGIATTGALADRGYRPIEMSTVLVQDLQDLQAVQDTADARSAPGTSELRVRIVEPADREAWVDASVAGWVTDPAIAPVVRSLAELVCRNDEMVHVLVDRGGTLIATASLGVHGGVALLSGATTIPPARGLGAQGLLLAARLAEARRRGCEIAMIVAEPGSTSQRNAERRGFRVAYTRTKWRLARPS